MTTIIKATGPAEFLGLVPALAGFTPRRSVVLMPFRGSRTQGAMRIDLPAPDVDAEQFADVALHALLQVPDTEAVAIAVYTDETAGQIPDGVLLPHLATVDALADVCSQAGLRVIEALCVTPGGWGDYRDEDAHLRPLTDITVPALAGIGDVSGDQLAGAELPLSDLVSREQVGVALREVTTAIENARLGRMTGHENPLTTAIVAAVLDDLPRFVESVLDAPTCGDPHRCAALLWCLSTPALRDGILVQWATDLDTGARAFEAQLLFCDERTPVPDAISDVFLGRGARPDPDRLGCALEAVRFAAAHAPRDAKVGALTAAAWLAWASGRSSHAGAYVDEALRLEPGHSMASLISSMLAAAMLPEWTLRRR